MYLMIWYDSDIKSPFWLTSGFGSSPTEYTVDPVGSTSAECL